MSDRQLLYQYHGPCLVWSLHPGYDKPCAEPSARPPEPLREYHNGIEITTSSPNDPCARACRSVDIYYDGKYAQYQRHLRVRVIPDKKRKAYSYLHLPHWLGATVVVVNGRIT